MILQMNIFDDAIVTISEDDEYDIIRLNDRLSVRARVVGDDHVSAGETVVISTSIESLENDDVEDVAIAASIQELAVRDTEGPFDVEDEEVQLSKKSFDVFKEIFRAEVFYPTEQYNKPVVLLGHSMGSFISLVFIEKFGDDVSWEKRSEKHRYVYFTGSKKQKKEMRKALKYPILPYPKGESKRYDTSATFPKQVQMF